MPSHLRDDDLRPRDVPAADASWGEIAAFGHRYHAYKVAGSLRRVATLTLQAHDQWVADGTLPSDLARLRLALFHTVRATHGQPPAPATEDWGRALVAAVGSAVRTRVAAPGGRTEPLAGRTDPATDSR